MLTIFHVSATLRHVKTQVPSLALSSDAFAPRAWHVAVAESSLRATSQELKATGLKRLLYAAAKRAMPCRIRASSPPALRCASWGVCVCADSVGVDSARFPDVPTESASGAASVPSGGAWLATTPFVGATRWTGAVIVRYTTNALLAIMITRSRAERQPGRFGRVRLMAAASSGSPGCASSAAYTSESAARASRRSPCSIAAHPAMMRLSRSDADELSGTSMDVSQSEIDATMRSSPSEKLRPEREYYPSHLEHMRLLGCPPL